MNLSSQRETNSPAFQRHIDDSLAITPHLASDLERLIDLGSGQGFPAIPIAIRTGIFVEMVEADRRKAAFLATVLATLRLPGRVTPCRIEAASLAPAACITARALAPLDRLLTLARPLVLNGGCCLFLKGPAAYREATEASRIHRFDFEIVATHSPRSNLVKITNLR